LARRIATTSSSSEEKNWFLILWTLSSVGYSIPEGHFHRNDTLWGILSSWYTNSSGTLMNDSPQKRQTDEQILGRNLSEQGVIEVHCWLRTFLSISALVWISPLPFGSEYLTWSALRPASKNIWRIDRSRIENRTGVTRPDLLNELCDDDGSSVFESFHDRINSIFCHGARVLEGGLWLHPLQLSLHGRDQTREMLAEVPRVCPPHGLNGRERSWSGKN
jgi:hypothetical protein